MSHLSSEGAEACVVALARSGDDRALAVLFERHHELIRRRVAYRLGPRLGRCIEVEDILQELFLLARGSPSRLRLESEGGFLAWVQRIAENRIRKMARDWAPKRRPRKGTTLSPLDVRGAEPEELDARGAAELRGRGRVDDEYLSKAIGSWVSGDELGGA